MSTVTIVITPNSASVIDLNSKCQKPTKPHEEVNALIDYLSAIVGGLRNASIQVVTRATDPGVTTDADPNSTSNTYNLT